MDTANPPQPHQKSQNSKKDAYYYKTKVIDYYLQYHNPELIASEVPYGRMRKMCDLVIIENDKTIGIEIKSDVDNTSRLAEQLNESLKVFDYVIAVVSPATLGKALESLPKHVGLLTLHEETIQIIKRPSLHTVEPIDIAHSIPGTYLKAIYSIKNVSGIDSMRKYLAQRYPRKIKESFRLYLLLKYIGRYELFKRDRGLSTHPDDLTLLSRGEIIE